VSRHDSERLTDIIAACDAIADYLAVDPELADGRTFDAIRMRMTEIGEAVKTLPAALTSRENGIPWSAIARMRDHLTHRYFDTAHAVVATTARDRIPALRQATARLLAAESAEGYAPRRRSAR
jgi:uncharacterized protein with HEPN domain